MRSARLFLPREAARFSACDCERYFANWSVEQARQIWTESEKRLVCGVMLGRFLDPATRPFFLYHFGPLVDTAVREFFQDRPQPSILELGCGSGSLSILFALLGARVVAVDLDPHLIAACRKRQEIYEVDAGRLSLEFRCANTLELPYQEMGPFDGIYSLFAFNMMQPSSELLPRMLGSLAQGGKVLISDGNRQSLFNRLFRPRPSLLPGEMSARLRSHGLGAIRTDYHCLLPPLLVRRDVLYRAGRRMEQWAQRWGWMPWLGVSYTIRAERVTQVSGLPGRGPAQANGA